MVLDGLLSALSRPLWPDETLVGTGVSPTAVVRMPPLGNPRGRVSSLPELKVQKDQNIQLFQEPRSDSLNILQSASKKGRHHSLMTYV